MMEGLLLFPFSLSPSSSSSSLPLPLCTLSLPSPGQEKLERGGQGVSGSDSSQTSFPVLS